MSLASFDRGGRLDLARRGQRRGHALRPRRGGAGPTRSCCSAGWSATSCRRLRPSTTSVAPGDTLVFATDGVGQRLLAGARPGAPPRRRSPTASLASTARAATTRSCSWRATSDERSDLRRFRAELRRRLRGHLAAGGETGLELAYELGREAVTGGLSLLDLAGIHHAVLAESLARRSAAGRARAHRRRGGGLLPREPGHLRDDPARVRRGPGEGAAPAAPRRRLRGLAEAALAVNSTLSVDEMLELVAERAREIVGARAIEREHRRRRTATAPAAPGRGREAASPRP